MKNNVTTTTMEKKLQIVQKKSAIAVDLVTTVIGHLSAINEEVDAQINEITEIKTKLQATENDLAETKTHNAKIIDKFRALIED